jgi:hypothetical protein
VALQTVINSTLETLERFGVPSRRRTDAQPPRRDPITEAIARRAYELFLARGAQPGRDLDDWLQAERELLDAARSERVTDTNLRPENE